MESNYELLEGHVYCGTNEPYKERTFSKKLSQMLESEADSTPIKVIERHTHIREGIPITWNPIMDTTEGDAFFSFGMRFDETEEDALDIVTFRPYQLGDPNPIKRAARYKVPLVIDLTDTGAILEGIGDGLLPRNYMPKNAVQELERRVPTIFVEYVKPLIYSYNRTLTFLARSYKGTILPLQHEAEDWRNISHSTQQRKDISGLVDWKGFVDSLFNPNIPNSANRQSNSMSSEGMP